MTAGERFWDRVRRLRSTAPAVVEGRPFGCACGQTYEVEGGVVTVFCPLHTKSASADASDRTTGGEHDDD